MGFICKVSHFSVFKDRHVFVAQHRLQEIPSLSLVESPLAATHSSKTEPAEVLETELVGPAVLYWSVNFYKVN